LWYFIVAGRKVKKRKPAKEYMKNYRDKVKLDPARNAALKEKDRKRKQMSQTKEKTLLSEKNPDVKTLLAEEKRKR